MRKENVLLAMSGGVDSSVSALLLKRQGYDVIGIHFILDKNKKDFKLVQKVAKELNLELIVEDISDKFQKAVIGYLVNEYNKNRTPNPCVKCNREIKFDLLKEFAEKMNCEKIATGHYAQIKEKEDLNGERFFSLKQAKDQTKDQTYYLYRLNQDDLKKTIFPLGEMKKVEIKEIAKKEELSFDSKESQDICFLSDSEKIKEFLEKNISEEISEGKIIEDENGTELGAHQGLVYYTIGQRKGLNLSGGPYFVIGKNESENELIVSSNRNHSSLVSDKIEFNETSWINELPLSDKKYLIKTRYQGSGTIGNVFQDQDGYWFVQLDESQWAPASGQSLVIYDENEVIGGGIIK